MELFTQHIGIAFGDYRRNVRIANVDVSNALAGSVDLFALLRKGWHRAGLPSYTKEVKDDGLFSTANTVIYMNPDVYEALDNQSVNATLHPALHLRPMEIEGREVMSYRGLPIEVSDGLSSAETLVA